MKQKQKLWMSVADESAPLDLLSLCSYTPRTTDPVTAPPTMDCTSILIKNMTCRLILLRHFLNRGFPPLRCLLMRERKKEKREVGKREGGEGEKKEAGTLNELILT